jgi:hypothetical protein
MKRLVIAALLLLAPVVGHAQQSGTDQERRAAFEARRDSLEAEVVQKFVRRLGRELKLSSAQQSQTEQVLRQSGLQRRELSRASMQLRGRIYRAARSDATPEAEFIRLLAEHEALRVREHDLWRRDQEQLARISGSAPARTVHPVVGALPGRHARHPVSPDARAERLT